VRAAQIVCKSIILFEVPHEVLVGVAEDVVVIGAILREIKVGFLEDAPRAPSSPSAALRAVKRSRAAKLKAVNSA
jgi:hypothetical protein